MSELHLTQRSSNDPSSSPWQQRNRDALVAGDTARRRASTAPSRPAERPGLSEGQPARQRPKARPGVFWGHAAGCEGPDLQAMPRAGSPVPPRPASGAVTAAWRRGVGGRGRDDHFGVARSGDEPIPGDAGGHGRQERHHDVVEAGCGPPVVAGTCPRDRQPRRRRGGPPLPLPHPPLAPAKGRGSLRTDGSRSHVHGVLRSRTEAQAHTRPARSLQSGLRRARPCRSRGAGQRNRPPDVR